MSKYRNYPLFVLWGLIVSARILSAQDESFMFSASSVHPYFPTYTGNGHFSLSSSPLGCQPAESYMIKVYDHGTDDIPRIACLPEWNEINYHNGVGWLNDFVLGDSLQLKNYKQTLDMYNGLLSTAFLWEVDGRKTDIRITSFISRDDVNLAVIRFEITPHFADTIGLLFPLRERARPKRLPFAKLETVAPNPPGAWPAEWYPGFMEVVNLSGKSEATGGALQALARTEGRRTPVTLASEIYSEGEIPHLTRSFEKSPDGKSADIRVSFRSVNGKTYTFYKLAAVVLGNDVRRAASICEAAKQSGYPHLLKEHSRRWNELWRTDIIVGGNTELQKTVHSMIYYLLCSIAENTEFSIPPMGLATAGYYGHIFWDADTYMFPPLLLMHPAMAKSMVMFRCRALESAKANARKNNYRGAMYPWESDERGEETTPFFAYQNALKENHIVGDVALAQWQYFLATGDTSWLREYGSKVITETAEFWTSRVNYNKEHDRYEIAKVVSVSEGLVDVSNETYTNAIAKLNLEIAIRVNTMLKAPVNPRWREISAKMFIPYNEKEEYHPTYGTVAAGEGATELWSSVTPLLTFPLQMPMSENAKRNNLLHAVRNLEQHGPGANMGSNFLPIIAAELGNDSLFHLTITKTLKGFLRPPFNVLAETHTNNSINFITGAGAFLQQVIFGYTGLRLTEEGLVAKYKPMLPDGVTSLMLKNISIRGKRYDISVINRTLRVSEK